MKTNQHKPYKIIIAGTSEIYIMGFQMFISKKFNVEICSANSAEELSTLTKRLNYDLCILEDKLLEKIKISNLFPKNKTIPKIILLVGENKILQLNLSEDYIIGTISKDISRQAFVDDLLLICSQYFYQEDFLKETVYYKIPPRMKEILRLICKEQSTKEIADQMCISVKTVEKYRKQLKEITGVRNVVGLSMFALDNNIL